MKTPREVLLERHRAAETKLNALRENVRVSAFPPADAPARQPFPVRAAFTLWRELVLPCRRVWAGLAAVWFAILLLNYCDGGSPKMPAGQTAASAPEVLMVLREQKQIVAELINPALPPPPVSAPAPAVPGPRGERRSAIRCA